MLQSVISATPAVMPMNRLSRLLAPTNVVLGLSVTSKKRLFEQVGLLFENNHGIERGKVFDSLFARERLGSTGLGEGVAIPHGRIKGLKEALAAVVRLAEPIPFDAPFLAHRRRAPIAAGQIIGQTFTGHQAFPTLAFPAPPPLQQDGFLMKLNRRNVQKNRLNRDSRTPRPVRSVSHGSGYLQQLPHEQAI